VADQLEQLLKRIGSTVGDFHWMRAHEGVEGNWPDWGELWKKIQEEIPALRLEIEDRFRELLDG